MRHPGNRGSRQIVVGETPTMEGVKSPHQGMIEVENSCGQAGTTIPLSVRWDQAGSLPPGDEESGGRSPSPTGRSDYVTIQIQSLTTPSPAPPKVPDYLGCSLFATMFCFLPLGVAALVYSVKTWSANRAGTTAAARRNLMISRQLNIGAVLIGLIVHFVWVARLIITVIERA
ncbi:hypothetical protein scyTo_0018942 [Scyliorhinus torazame]|uniref:Uncharacterized protein n=1 Tax=Scyliorhinus torazame TaxID=75743 RepID=A0A401PPI7_SCYTO|nr:hypothetical protein [Scyliorhinus torazame]